MQELIKKTYKNSNNILFVIMSYNTTIWTEIEAIQAIIAECSECIGDLVVKPAKGFFEGVEEPALICFFVPKDQEDKKLFCHKLSICAYVYFDQNSILVCDEQRQAYLVGYNSIIDLGLFQQVTKPKDNEDYTLFNGKYFVCRKAGD